MIKKNIKISQLPILKNFPSVEESSFLSDVLSQKDEYTYGTVVVLDKNNYLRGIITDGDLRRIIINSKKHFSDLMLTSVSDIMKKKPKFVYSSENLNKAIKLLKSYQIIDLVVIDKSSKKVIGLLNIHQLI